MGDIRIGISGWRYDGWRGVFYPPGLVQRRELEFASRALPTIEINGSFYALQRPESYAGWYETVPPDFIFSVKATRYVTHVRRLRDVEVSMANFFASGLFNLREKLGPILWQLPPNLGYDADRLESFLALLPHDGREAMALAAKCAPFMADRSVLETDEGRPLRHALEVRNASFLDVSFVALLRKYRVALVVADTAGKWPYCEDVTSDFIYLRLHGDVELYASGYTDAALERWAARIRAWSAGSEPDDARRIGEASPPRRAGRDVYCYFDNDVKVRAPFDARTLLDKLGIGSPVPVPAAEHAGTGA
jgi:uncharacterized protein YecE (DUF72 family)